MWRYSRHPDYLDYVHRTSAFLPLWPKKRLRADGPVDNDFAKQLMVRVQATYINPIDWKIRSGNIKMFALHRRNQHP